MLVNAYSFSLSDIVARVWLMSTAEEGEWLASIFDPENGEIIGNQPGVWLGSRVPPTGP